MAKLYYLASPYSSKKPGVQEMRYNSVVDIAAKLFSQGIFTISPIILGHPMASKLAISGDFETWEALDRELLARCDTLLIIKLFGWEKSKGIAQEIKIAKELGKEILELRPDVTGIFLDDFCPERRRL